MIERVFSSQKVKRRPSVVDLFAGAGGLALGFEQAGFDVQLSVELDPVHAATHAHNFPRTPTIIGNLADPRILDAALSELRLDPPDVLIGGPPCQGFSSIGKRASDDDRNNLIFSFATMVRLTKPKYFVLENVPGLAQGKSSASFANLIELLSKDYSVQPPRILNASHFGAPQNRKRLVILGSRSDVTCALYPLPRYTFAGNWRRNAPAGISVRNALADLRDIRRFQPDIHGTVRLTDRQMYKSILEMSEYAARLAGVLDDDSKMAYRRFATQGQIYNFSVPDHSAAVRSRFTHTKPGEIDEASRLYRLHECGLSNTLRAGTAADRGSFTAPRPIHPYHDRVITVREAARLSGFPDWFRFHQTSWHGFRQIGNAVPPPLARAIAEQIISAMSVSPIQSGSFQSGDARLIGKNLHDFLGTLKEVRVGNSSVLILPAA